MRPIHDERGPIRGKRLRDHGESGRFTANRAAITANRGVITANRPEIMANRRAIMTNRGRIAANQGRFTVNRPAFAANQGRFTVNRGRRPPVGVIALPRPGIRANLALGKTFLVECFAREIGTRRLWHRVSLGSPLSLSVWESTCEAPSRRPLLSCAF